MEDTVVSGLFSGECGSSSVPALVTDCLPVRKQNDRIASTIADDRVVASIQGEALSFVVGNKHADRHAYFGVGAHALLAVHIDLLSG